jgi:hypothetical protein
VEVTGDPASDQVHIDAGRSYKPDGSQEWKPMEGTLAEFRKLDLPREFKIYQEFAEDAVQLWQRVQDPANKKAFTTWGWG